MSRPKRPEERTRLNLEATVEFKKRLEAFRIVMNADSMTEVIRRSVATAEALHDLKNQGADIIAQMPDGTKYMIVIA